MLKLKVIDSRISVCRLETDKTIPSWVYKSSFFSITKTDDELSIVCSEESAPDGIIKESGWRMIKVMGPLDFGMVGILVSISNILAKRQISIFAISTYDTDYILLKDENLQKGIEALLEDNYQFV